MKKILITLAVMALFAGVTQAARQNAVDKEMEDYARDLFRAHPEAAGDDKPRDAAKKMYEDAKQNRLLELTKDEEKKSSQTRGNGGCRQVFRGHRSAQGSQQQRPQNILPHQIR